MPVWVVGFPRCGSASVCRALRVLGLDPIHNPRSWAELAGHNAAGDLMITAHWRDLLRAYPSSRFILNTRPVDDWLRSLATISGFWRSQAPFARIYRPAVYGTDDPHDHRTLRRRWKEHHLAVRRWVPSKRLLVFQQPFTWPPLAEFLGRPAPAAPFPWLNRGSAIDVGAV